MRNPFTSHPADVNESYSQHLVHASGFGVRMVWAGLACMVHALLPFLFVKTGSRAITELHDRMVTNRHNLSAPASGAERSTGRASG